MTASFVVIVGDPGVLYGPFPTANAAAKWAATELGLPGLGTLGIPAWRIAPLNSATEDTVK